MALDLCSPIKPPLVRIFVAVQIIGVEASTLLPMAKGTTREQHDSLVAVCDSLEPQLAALRDRMVGVQQKASSFHGKLSAFETVVSPELENLLVIDVPTVFSAGLGDCSLTLPKLLETWEAEVRRVAVRFAEVQATHNEAIATCRLSIQKMGVHEPDDLLAALPDFAPTHEATVVAEAVTFLAGAVESEPLARTMDAPFVACLRDFFSAVTKAHGARADVAETANRFLETWFVAVHNRLLAGKEHSPLSPDRMAAAVSEVASCLNKTRLACEGSIAKVQGKWLEHGTALEARVVIPDPWMRPVDGRLTVDLADAARLGVGARA